MAHKQILFHSAAREKVLRGATLLADAVRVTLGPKSKSVLIQKSWGAPIVCNDGVTIAKEFDLKDPEENLGAQILRQAAEKTGDVVGDGTSTSTILAHAILADGVRNVVAGASAIDLKRGLDRARTRRDRGTACNVPPGEDESGEGAGRNLSAHNDPAIGALVADAIEKVGSEGVIIGRRIEDHGNHAGCRRGHEIRPRLYLALLRHRRGDAWRPCWKTHSCCCATTRSARCAT